MLVDSTTHARINPTNTHLPYYSEQLAGIQYATETPRQPKVWDKLAKNLQGLSLPPGALNMNMKMKNMNIDMSGFKNVFNTNKKAATAATAAGEA